MILLAISHHAPVSLGKQREIIADITSSFMILLAISHHAPVSLGKQR